MKAYNGISWGSETAHALNVEADRLRAANEARTKSNAPPSSTPTADPFKPTEGKCHLLDLSPELRNVIYRYTLVEDSDGDANTRGVLIIDKSNCAQPGLLRTCKQIRGEANLIYYYQNGFIIQTPKFNSVALQKFCVSAGWHDNMDMGRITIRHDTGSMSWANLIRWMWAFHKGIVPSCIMCEDRGDLGHRGVCCTAVAVSKDVANMKGRPWPCVLHFLDCLRFAEETAAGL